MLELALYQLTQRDDPHRPVEIYHRFVSDSDGQNLSAVFDAVPGDRVLFLANVHLRAVGGGVSLPTRVLLQGVDQASAQNYDVCGGNNNNQHVNNQDYNFSEYVGVYLLPGAVLTASAAFNSANAGNQMTATINGMLFPRGNID